MSSGLRTKESATKSTPWRDAEGEVGAILLGERLGAQRHAGQVDPLVLAELAALDHLGRASAPRRWTARAAR